MLREIVREQNTPYMSAYDLNRVVTFIRNKYNYNTAVINPIVDDSVVRNIVTKNLKQMVPVLKSSHFWERPLYWAVQNYYVLEATFNVGKELLHVFDWMLPSLSPEAREALAMEYARRCFEVMEFYNVSGSPDPTRFMVSFVMDLYGTV